MLRVTWFAIHTLPVNPDASVDFSHRRALFESLAIFHCAFLQRIADWVRQHHLPSRDDSRLQSSRTSAHRALSKGRSAPALRLPAACDELPVIPMLPTSRVSPRRRRPGQEFRWLVAHAREKLVKLLSRQLERRPDDQVPWQRCTHPRQQPMRGEFQFVLVQSKSLPRNINDGYNRALDFSGRVIAINRPPDSASNSPPFLNAHLSLACAGKSRQWIGNYTHWRGWSPYPIARHQQESIFPPHFQTHFWSYFLRHSPSARCAIACVGQNSGRQNACPSKAVGDRSPDKRESPAHQKYGE